MLPQTDNQKISLPSAKKRDDAIDFAGFNQMTRYLNGVSPSLSNR
jgi:hypothetical protein